MLNQDEKHGKSQCFSELALCRYMKSNDSTPQSFSKDEWIEFLDSGITHCSSISDIETFVSTVTTIALAIRMLHTECAVYEFDQHNVLFKERQSALSAIKVRVEMFSIFLNTYDPKRTPHSNHFDLDNTKLPWYESRSIAEQLHTLASRVIEYTTTLDSAISHMNEEDNGSDQAFTHDDGDIDDSDIDDSGLYDSGLMSVE